jgi:UDP:flavonoid glycosyltransferase YjiC (YdhE family)
MKSGEPPIVFTLGDSTSYAAKDFWLIAADTVKAIGRRAVFLTGRGVDFPSCESIKSFSYIPYRFVFPYASLSVHHAGLGTMAQAMYSGIPQLSLPSVFDQFDNAFRLEKLGVSRTLLMKKLSKERLKRLLEAVLNDPSYKENANQLAAKLEGRNGAENAANVLIEFADAHSSSRNS